MGGQQSTPSIAIQMNLKPAFSVVAAAVCVGASKMSCRACSCHKCRGLAAEFEQMKTEVAQVAQLQKELQHLRRAATNLADQVANLQIQCRVHGGDDTIEYSPMHRGVVILD